MEQHEVAGRWRGAVVDDDGGGGCAAKGGVGRW
jgi:hypothetical protein